MNAEDSRPGQPLRHVPMAHLVGAGPGGKMARGRSLLAQGLAKPLGKAALAPLRALLEARDSLLSLAAVALGCGIWLWFRWPLDPGPGMIALAALLVPAALVLRLTGPEIMRAPAILVLALVVGFLAADLRAHVQAAPVLERPYYGPIEGRVIRVDRSRGDDVRITLDQPVLRRLSPGDTPALLRVSVQDTRHHLPQPGETVILTGYLAPPGGPAEPGGFDFARIAFFQRIGAVGYSRTPVLLLEPPERGEAWVGRVRAHLSAVIRAHIPGQPGAFAAGVLTGDRAAIDQQTVAILRDSSLAHVLAISGLHLSMLAGFVLAIIRGGIALVPPIALRVNGRKIAAGTSLVVALGYLVLSGASVSTQRAFVMIAVMLVAVLLDRRALSPRSVAISALIVLLAAPESLHDPGFQMSYAATIALIAGFRRLESLFARTGRPRWLAPVTALLASSLIGGFATAPWAAADFNRFPEYGLLANILAVPAMGLVVMPMGVLALMLAPFGLAALPLWLMGQGTAWILLVAGRVAAMEGSVRVVPGPAPGILALFTLGALWLVIWNGRARHFGTAAAVAALTLWPLSPRPLLLISADGRLVGLMGEAGRALSSPRAGSYAARSWLDRDGDGATQHEAAARPGFAGPAHARSFSLAGRRGVVLSGKQGAAILDAACAGADLVVLGDRAEAVPEGCLLIDRRVLDETGALAIEAAGDGLRIVPARGARRLWSGRAMDPGLLLAMLPPGMALARWYGEAP